MDQKIRFYLSDRQKNPHPRHIEFIEKVQRYRIDPAVSNKHLESLLDNLQWKVYYYQRAWNQMFENAEAAYRQNRQPVLDPTLPPAGQAAGETEPSKPRAQYSIDNLWKVQVEKLKQYGVEPQETQEEFQQRMYQEYRALKKNQKENQEVVMVYDVKEQKCRLDLKDK